ncbi:MAG: TetR/AcrR family transcriptional regulator [Vicinamibacteria bacterium]
MTTQSNTREALLEKFRVESITEGALRAIARKGAAATMQDIADESGISKGTLYLYFKDREQLLERVSHAGFGELIGKVDAIIAKNLSFDQTVRELVLMNLRFFDERRDLYRVHFELSLTGGQDPVCKPILAKTPPPEKQVLVDRLITYFEGAFESKQEAGRLALFFSETMKAVLLRRIPETNGVPLEDDAEFLADVLLNGLSGKRKKS